MSKAELAILTAALPQARVRLARLRVDEGSVIEYLVCMGACQ